MILATAANTDTSLYGEISLLIFFALFLGVLFYAFRRRNQKTFEHAAQLPLEDDHDSTRTSPLDREVRNHA